MGISFRVRSGVLLCGLAINGAVVAQSADRVIIDGSTGVTPLVAALAKSYHEQHAGADIQIGKGMGTKARIQALAEGRIDIAMASHGLNVREIEKQGMVVHEIAKVAVVFGVNATVPIATLTDTQVCDIYSGRATNWQALGGPELPIAAFARPESEVDTEVVRDQLPCLKTMKFAESVRIAPKTPEMTEALSTTRGAFGVTTMTVVEQSQEKIKVLALRGVAPTSQNVQSRSYTLTRDSFLVVKSPPSPATARFIEFVRSAAGQKIIATNGAVPVK
jgi:phosphate transport system substrate-binding protein